MCLLHLVWKMHSLSGLQYGYYTVKMAWVAGLGAAATAAAVAYVVVAVAVLALGVAAVAAVAAVVQIRAALAELPRDRAVG